jgi:hypothetical protein
MSAPRPVSTPPTEVASRLPPPTVSKSFPAWRALGREIVGKVLTVARADHMLCRMVTKEPGDESHRNAMGFQMARRQIDDEASNFAMAYRFEPGHDDLDMRRKIQSVTWVQFVKTALDEARQIPLEDQTQLLRRKGRRGLEESRALHFESSIPSPRASVLERASSLTRMRRTMFSITSLFSGRWISIATGPSVDPSLRRI